VEPHGIVRFVVQGKSEKVERDDANQPLRQVVEQGGEVAMEGDRLGNLQKRAVLFYVRLENRFDSSILAGFPRGPPQGYSP